MMAVEIDGADEVEIELLPLDHSPEIEVEELLLGRVEPEAGEDHRRTTSLHVENQSNW